MLPCGSIVLFGISMLQYVVLSKFCQGFVPIKHLAGKPECKASVQSFVLDWQILLIDFQKVGKNTAENAISHLFGFHFI